MKSHGQREKTSTSAPPVQQQARSGTSKVRTIMLTPIAGEITECEPSDGCLIPQCGGDRGGYFLLTTSGER